MNISDFEYDLPDRLIAQDPAPTRSGSRLLVIRKSSGTLHDHAFSDLSDLLPAGTAVVLNESRVIPARIFGIKVSPPSHQERVAADSNQIRTEGGARIEVLLLEPLGPDTWKVLANRAKRLREGTRIHFTEKLMGEVMECLDRGQFIFRFESEGNLETALDEAGEMPLPPYIKRPAPRPEDRERYQTVYARVPGSAAAPTAGLHFDKKMLQKLEQAGHRLVRVALHVGLDTFRPVLVEKVEQHEIHSESYEVSPEAALALNEARSGGRSILAVGTTSVRTLETSIGSEGMYRAGQGKTSLFIYPGYRFRGVDLLLTNFHLPRSSLLLLVAAFLGDLSWRTVYEEAVRREYRFYSYGDAMLVLP